jgi:phosphate transport system substrate-binding protein
VPLTAATGTSLRVLKLDGVYPSAENVLERSYRLSLPLAVVYKGPLSGLAKSFVEFVFSDEGTNIMTRMGAVPGK